MKKFVTVAVKTVYIADKPYTYEVPSNAFVEIGSLVRVPLGKGNKTCDGVFLFDSLRLARTCKCFIITVGIIHKNPSSVK